ncbi:MULTISPECIES: hypothetical protein [Methanothermobacter]|nr:MULTISPECIES: hypothetical protein [Methanothermobacter]MBC7111389.1 hypothetical protein [Methanothermobacter sp.]REE29102.1 hypothetical protein C7452_1135 [Methanothermobacter defluvii]WBF06531.1 hypothetical protein ISG35_00950 [Methanothermobacter thermautotrophicus]HOQ18068.1 hypothetical protein [Methanothermobacter thermautotrophicus]
MDPIPVNVAVTVLVSVAVWSLLEFIPLLFPGEAGRLAARLRPLPSGLMEVTHHINLLRRGRPWQRFMAREVIAELFKTRLQELEALKYEEWRSELESQKELMERRELSDDEILHIEAGKEMMVNSEGEMQRAEGAVYPTAGEEEFIRIRNHKKELLDDLRDRYSDFRIWAPRNRDILRYIQDKVFRREEFDLEGLRDHSREWALVNIWGMEPPVSYPEEELLEDLLLYLELMDDDSTAIKLARALSGNDDSLRYLDEVIRTVSAWKTGEDPVFPQSRQ